MDNYNDAAFKNYNEKGLMPCPNCARTFLPDRLEIHLRSCNKKYGIAAEEDKSKSMGAKSLGGPGRNMGGASSAAALSSTVPKRPKTLVCYICGREYGTSSLEIHLKTCKKKWLQEEELKPKHERRPLPPTPKNIGDVLGGA